MNNNSSSQLQNRYPAVAGQFYSAEKDKLSADLKELFSEAELKKYNNVIAIISPHAGYVFSGSVAASAFNQIDPDKNYKNIFLIGSSHRMSFEGASIYNKGDFITPLGTVKVDIELANKLIEDNKIFRFGIDAHLQEHCLEVPLPFLQYIMKTDYSIIPIIIGANNDTSCRGIAKALKPFFNSDNLFIISTDFSHYPDYDDALKIDNLTAEAIISNSPDKLLKALHDNDKKNIPGLATSLCGWTSVLTLLYMTEDNPDIKYNLVSYKNSGDSRYGDKKTVVGYYSVAVSAIDKSKSDLSLFNFSDKDKNDLLSIARSSLMNYVKGDKFSKLIPEEYSPALLKHYGAFVTLYKNKKLRGCIGRFAPDIPLYEVVREMTIAAASEDSRFNPVTTDELNDIEIEISVLSPLKRINSISEIDLGKHGIYIKKGLAGGTFLPKVASDTKWTKEEFLSYCSRDKAGIGWDGWKDKNAEIFIYEALVISE